MPRTLLIDNYDSFTFNIYQLLAAVDGSIPIVVRNDEITWAEVKLLDVDSIVLSPGPGRPDRDADFGVCREVIAESTIPVLGICLGHQGISFLHGGRVDRAPEPMHGRLSDIIHDGTELFEGIPNPLRVVRYHSLVVAPDVPTGLIVQAKTMDGIVMAVRVRDRPQWGIQFHPESISAEHGEQLIRNFRRLTQTGTSHKSNCQPAYSALPLDLPSTATAQLETPHFQWQVRSRRLGRPFNSEAVFAKCFADSPSAFWLDSSAVVSGVSRFSFMGDTSCEAGELIMYWSSERRLELHAQGRITESRESIFDYLSRMLKLRKTVAPELPFDFCGGYVGYFGYEMKAECGGNAAHIAATADAAFIFVDRFIAFDHRDGDTWLVHLSAGNDPTAGDDWFGRMEHMVSDATLPLEQARVEKVPFEYRLRHEREEYIRLIGTAQREIRDGESYEICLTNTFTTQVSAKPFDLYRSLREINPAPYSAFLKFPMASVLCSSPERFLRIDQDRVIESKPIKGTIQRGATASEDADFRTALASSEKDRAENLMIVDLVRNDLGRVCEIGSVCVPSLMGIESFATVHQMVSTIRGHLKHDCGPIDAIRATFPGGSMTGAPKLRTMEIIDRLEGSARGIYSGALGFLALNDTTDLNIAIRTIVINQAVASIGAGGAITHLSDPDAEFDEMLLKGCAPLRALGCAPEVCSEKKSLRSVTAKRSSQSED